MVRCFATHYHSSLYDSIILHWKAPSCYLLQFTLFKILYPCRFGVRIVLLYPPACRKRRVKGGVRGSLVVTFAAARCQGPRFYPGQGRNSDRNFYFMRTTVPPLGPQHRVPEPVPSLETHLESE